MYEFTHEFLISLFDDQIFQFGLVYGISFTIFLILSILGINAIFEFIVKFHKNKRRKEIEK